MAEHTAPYLWEPVTRALHAHGARRVFDAGCGDGDFVAYLNARGFEAVGVDHSAKDVSRGLARSPNAPISVASAYDDLAAKFGTFDAVTCVEMIEHCDRPRAVVRTLHGLLAAGGLLVVTTPYHGYLKNLAISVTNGWDSHFTALWDGGHVKFWSPATLTTLLAEVGLHVRAVHRVGRVLPALAKSMIVEAQHLGNQGDGRLSSTDTDVVLIRQESEQPKVQSARERAGLP